MKIETEYDFAKSPTVYGNKVFTYAIGGTSGCCFADVLSYAAIGQSNSFENLTVAYADVVKVRQVKVNDLAEALATITEALGTFGSEHGSEDLSSLGNPTKMKNARELLGKYGISFTLNESGEATFGELSYRQNDVQTALDMENNNLRRILMDVEGLVNKRDNAFSSANTIIGKSNSTALSTIQAMGA